MHRIKTIDAYAAGVTAGGTELMLVVFCCPSCGGWHMDVITVTTAEEFDRLETEGEGEHSESFDSPFAAMNAALEIAEDCVTPATFDLVVWHGVQIPAELFAIAQSQEEVKLWEHVPLNPSVN